MVQISAELPWQRPDVLALNTAAFGGGGEAELIEKLTQDGLAVLSLVATKGQKFVGHIFFSRLDVEMDGRRIDAVALAPMAVLPQDQRKGIGSALVKRALDLLPGLGIEAVIVVGHIGFYPRFGFAPALAKNLACPFQGSDAFMGLELKPGALSGKKGVCRYPAAFGLSA